MKHSFTDVGFTMARRDTYALVKPLGTGGYLAAAARPGMARRTAILDSLWVSPARRGNGLGGKVLADLLAFTDLLALDVVLEVNPYDQPSGNPERLAALYGRAGFVRLRARREWPRIVMRRNAK